MLKRTDLAADQRSAIDFILDGEDTLLAADVGSGKTVIGLTAAMDAVEAGRTSRWLVAAPKRVAQTVWGQETLQWDHLDPSMVAVACGDVKQRKAAIESDAPIVVTNYENLSWLMGEYPRRTIKGKRRHTLPFDGLMCDEIDKLKSVSTDRFKQVRNNIGHLKMRVSMTGTMTPNRLEEIWGLAYMTDAGQTFGRSFYDWRKENFYPTDFKQFQWAPFPGTFEKVVGQLKGLVFRLEAKGIPQAVIQPSIMVDLPDVTREAVYKQLEKEYTVKLGDGSIVIDADNAGILAGKLQQITAGFSYYGDKKNRKAIWHSKAKFGALEGLIDRLDGQQLMIGYHFNQELAELQRRYPGIHHLGGGQTDTQAQYVMDAWNAGDLPLLPVHPSAAGHGLNLQHSGAHNIAFLTMPWSGGMFAQIVGRLARRGQVAKQVDVWPLLCENTIDLAVLATVERRREELRRFLDALK